MDLSQRSGLATHQMNEILLFRGIVAYLLIGHALYRLKVCSADDQLIWPVSLVGLAAYALRRL